MRTHKCSKAPPQVPSAVNFQRRGRGHSHVQSDKSARVSGGCCHTHVSSASGRAFVDFAALCWVDDRSTVSFFQAQDVQKQQ